MPKILCLGFSKRDLKVIEWRTHGVKTPEIARRLGIGRKNAYDVLHRVYKKAGVNDVALLTRWAIENAMDEPLGPEDPEDAEIKPPKVYKQRIRLGRLRRARAQMG